MSGHWDDDVTAPAEDKLNAHAAARGRALWNDKRRRGQVKKGAGQLSFFGHDLKTDADHMADALREKRDDDRAEWYQ